MGQALTALLAAQHAVSLNLESFILEVDSSTIIITPFNPDLTIDWSISPIILKTFLDSSR
jgi:hypothetical protein